MIFIGKRTQKAKDAKNLKRQVKVALSKKCAYGESRYFDKFEGKDKNKIYSRKTYETYAREAVAFAKWVEEKYNVHDLGRAEAYAKEYIQERNANPKISAWSVKTSAAALAKLFGVPSSAFGETRGRAREDIKRSRGQAVRDKHFSEEKHQDLVDFCRGTGLRRHEAEKVVGTDYDPKTGKIHVTGKGGKHRMVTIVGEHREAIIEKMRRAGSGKVWGKISSAADIHSYRADYATTYYNSIARAPEDIPPQDRYYCRGDLAGIWYDRKAMEKVSESMGHTRVSVIAGHYLRGGE